MSYYDFFDAAREALDLSVTDPSRGTYTNRLKNIRASSPRAYTPWTGEDDSRLGRMVRDGLTVAQIAHRLQRQRSAIRSRIVKLDLVGGLAEPERAELHRISALDPRRNTELNLG